MVAALFVAAAARCGPPRGDPGQAQQARHDHGHGLEQVRGHVLQVGPDRAEAEGDLARLVPGFERAAIYEIIEYGHPGTEDRDRREPPAGRARGHARGPPPAGGQHGHDGAAEHDDVGVAHEHGSLDSREAEQPGPGAPPSGGVVGQQGPQQRAGAGGDQRGIGERRHVVPPREQQRRAGGAEKPDRRGPAVGPEPAPGTEEQADAAKGAVEQGGQPDDAERRERRGEERVAGVLLADPPPVRQLHPLLDLAGRSRAGQHPAAARIGQLRGQRANLGGGQCQRVPVGQRGDRGAVGEVVGFHELGHGRQDDDAQHTEGRQGKEDLGAQRAARRGPG
jgi:hypothetical protein